MASAFESFVAVHQYQLESIPQDLWQPLFMKLGEDYLDAGSVMELHQGDPLPGLSLHLKQDGEKLEKHSDIYLIDHAWTTTPETAKQQLRDNPTTLLERLENLMGIEAEEGWVDDDEEDDDIEHDDELISMVAEQANVSYERAKQALIDENYEVVNAIANLTIDPEFQKQADALQDQVLGQLIASGKAQEKEDTVKKEKEEKKQHWINNWMDRRVNKVYDTMWSFIQTYSYTVLKTDGQSAAQTALYVNDEVGSAISHSSQPNMVCVPFIFSRGATGMIPYSVLFPIRTIQPGELITCDLLPKTLERDIDRQAYLYAIQDRLAPEEQLNDDERQKMLQKAFKTMVEASDKDTINTEGMITNQEKYSDALLASAASSDIVKVYTDVECIRSGVTLPNLQWVNEQDQADITWTKTGLSSTSSSLRTNLTCQQNLSQLVRRAYGFTSSASWFLPAYPLANELAECVGDYLEQASLVAEEGDQQVLWMAQPYDSSDQQQPSQRRRIISTLPELIRQYDTPMAPQLAQHYPSHPCLYNGKKFHLRYMALLNRSSPSGAWFAGVYNKMFWVRLANKKFNMEDLHDRDRQFLVGNDSGFEMTALDHTSFIRHMEKEHTSLQWNDVQENINKVIKDVLFAASIAEKDASDSSFGVFTLDFMLTDSFQPIIMDIQTTMDPSSVFKDDKGIINNLLSVMDSRFGALDKGLETFTLL